MFMLPWIAGLLLGALAPAAIFAAISGQLTSILPLAFAVTLGHAVILGLPAALLYRAKRWDRPWAAIAGAALIGMLPGGILTWPFNPSSRGMASANGIVTWVDGIPTWAGWISYGELVAGLALLGAVGGLVCWLALRACGLVPAEAQTIFKPRLGILLASVAVIGSGSVAALPSLTMDRSCHNMFRDGKRSVSTVVNIDLDIAPADWSALAKLLEQFGQSHRMSFRDLGQSQPQVVDMLYLSVCAENGLAVSVNEQRWLTGDHAPSDRGVCVSMYDPRGDHDWHPLARDLIVALDRTWNGKVRFRDGRGRFVPAPAELMLPQGATPPG